MNSTLLKYIFKDDFPNFSFHFLPLRAWVIQVQPRPLPLLRLPYNPEMAGVVVSSLANVVQHTLAPCITGGHYKEGKDYILVSQLTRAAVNFLPTKKKQIPIPLHTPKHTAILISQKTITGKTHDHNCPQRAFY